MEDSWYLNVEWSTERLFNLFWINGSWQKKLNAEDAEKRKGLLFFSASLSVLCGFTDRPENNKKSRNILLVHYKGDI